MLIHGTDRNFIENLTEAQIGGHLEEEMVEKEEEKEIRVSFED